MFTGIIEHTGTLESLELRAEGGRLTILAPKVAPSLAVSSSIAVNGCCLTVVSRNKRHFAADLSGETIRRTSFGAKDAGLKLGARVNLERPLTAGQEFGGHFVQGHVDGIGRVAHLTPEGESWRLGVRVPVELARYVPPKGSLAVDGISLTIAGLRDGIVECAIIPYTYAHTNLRDRKPGDAVNLEVDMLAKYLERLLDARSEPPPSRITLTRLIDEGF